MSKVYVMPVDRLNLDDLRQMFKQAKQDARSNKAASNGKGEQTDNVSK